MVPPKFSRLSDDVRAAPRTLRERYDLPLLGGLIAAFVVTVLLWDFTFLYPLKIFVVLLHELSHGMAALLTGGSIDRIELSPDQGGVCYTVGGARLVVLMAGYLGSMLWGGLLLLVASRTRFEKQFMVGLGALLALVALLWARGTFAFAFTLGAAATFIALGVFAKRGFVATVLKYFGLVSCLYAILDIWDDAVSRNLEESDATRFGDALGVGGSTFWGIAWIGLALLFAAWVLRQAVRKGSAERR